MISANLDMLAAFSVHTARAAVAENITNCVYLAFSSSFLSISGISSQFVVHSGQERLAEGINSLRVTAGCHLKCCMHIQVFYYSDNGTKQSQFPKPMESSLPAGWHEAKVDQEGNHLPQPYYW